MWVQQECVPLNLHPLLPSTLTLLHFPSTLAHLPIRGCDIDRPRSGQGVPAWVDLRCGVQQEHVPLNLTPPPSLAHLPIPGCDIDRPRSGQGVPGLPALVDLRCGSSKHMFPLTSPLPLPSPTCLSVAVILIGPGQVRESLASLHWWTSGVGPVMWVIGCYINHIHDLKKTSF